MLVGDILLFQIRAQNAALLLHKFPNHTTFSSFETSPSASSIISTKRKLIISFPGPTISIPAPTVSNPNFLATLSDFLSAMNVDILAEATSSVLKAKSSVRETRDTPHPMFITELLTGILRGFGEVAEVRRIQKRVADDVLWDNVELPWRRSPLWLAIRVTLQTALSTHEGDHSLYKSFMLFLMTSLLQDSLTSLPNLSSELLSTMRAKIAWRLKKIENTAPKELISLVDSVSLKVETVLQNRWNAIQAIQAQSPLWSPKMLSPTNDTSLTLTQSRTYLREVISKKSTVRKHPRRTLPETVRYKQFVDYISSNEDDLTFLSSRFESSSIGLADFEYAVKEGLESWVTENMHKESASTVVAQMWSKYKNAALRLYEGNPESSSIMLLTMTELWVALDRIAIHHHPLLAHYPPEIPSSIFNSLLLRGADDQLPRLAHTQLYIQTREETSDPANYPSIFSKDIGNAKSFAVRFFDASPSLQEKLGAIEKRAEVVRDEKKREVDRKNGEYAQTKAESRESEHECYYDARLRRIIRKYCTKCRLERKLSTFSIKLHEWPLPTSPTLAKVVAFEIYAPLVFRTWRDKTYTFLNEICRTDKALISQPLVTLQKYYNEFSGLYLRAVDCQITIASSTKSFVQSHYRETKGPWPMDPSEVCVNNALQFALYDSSSKSWVSEVSGKQASLAHHCCFQLPEGPYNGLQYSIDSTSHTTNRVVASQSSCPVELNIHEFLAFGCLRSGPLVQWLNILREIRARSLSFGKEEVYMLLVQSSSQVGPVTNTMERSWHAELQIPEFRKVLLQELRSLLLSSEANWTLGTAVLSVIALTSRLLASVDLKNPFPYEDAYALLRDARRITLSWVKHLRQVLQTTTDETKIQEIQALLVQSAATCKQTYDVPDSDLPCLLNSPADVKDYIFCSITIYENLTLLISASDSIGLLARDQRLSHRLEPVLCGMILEDSQGLHDAIIQVWDSYTPVTWEHVGGKSGWFESSSTRQSIQFNLLEGRLLVDGQAVGRLPQNITTHKTFKMILDNTMPDVIPADTPGMDFCLCEKIFDHQLYFLLRESDGELIARAQLGSRILELIPPCRFKGDLPDSFVKDFVPWMDLTTYEIEFRPMAARWISSTGNWRLSFSPAGRSTMSKRGINLVDIRSPTANMISTRLNPIEYTYNHIITLGGGVLSVELPRLGLSFFVDGDGELQSRNFRKMIVDHNQSSGTMFGLKNQLVLCHSESLARTLPCSRTVIIPHGTISWQRHGHHVQINVDTSTLDAVKFHLYSIDTDLGRLIGNISLISKLFRAYLHALSSHCLPDPLLGYTGVEEAVGELQSAGCLSFQSLEADELEILNCIASLVPTREYYPSHLKVMQKIHPSLLPELSQHYSLYLASKAIVDHAVRLQIFSTSPASFSFHFRSAEEIELQERAAIRKAIYHPTIFGSSFVGSEKLGDVTYKSRHIPGSREAEACNISAMTYSWPAKAQTISDLFGKLSSWGKLEGANKTFSIKYSNLWLQPCLPDIWLSWYNLFRSMPNGHNCYSIAFALSAMVYGAPETKELLPTLLSFATAPNFRALPPPDHLTYNFSYDFTKPRENDVKSAISSNRNYSGSPESRLEGLEGERQRDLHSRRLEAFETQSKLLENTMLEDVLHQWPCQTVEVRSPECASRFHLDAIIPALNTIFKNCYQNMELREHINAVQHELDSIRSQSSFVAPCHYELAPVEFVDALGHHVTLHDLFERVTAPSFSVSCPSIPERYSFSKRQKATTEYQALASLAAELTGKDDIFSKRYGKDLEKSLRHLRTEAQTATHDSTSYTMEDVITYRDAWQDIIRTDILDVLQISLTPSQQRPVDRILCRAGLWPRLTWRHILRNLASISSQPLPSTWEVALTFAGKMLLSYQQSQRLVYFMLNGNLHDFEKELANISMLKFSNVSAPDTDIEPAFTGDWLLIQIECNFLIRDVQLDVARNMISPASGNNTSLQLNMGEGKSSVIVPLIATSLADGKTLVRIIVLKALTKQAFHTLVDRLGGMVNRQVFYLPFSRDLTVQLKEAQAIHAMYEECIDTRGILVIQPDHILSYKLMSIDRQLSHSASEIKVVNTLLRSQKWLESKSRDIIDEADEILHVRYQLVYTVGKQSALECSPRRWLLIQEVLKLIKVHAPEFKILFPDGLQLVEQIEDSQARCNPFPFIRFLQNEAADAMIFRIAKEVSCGALESFRIQYAPPTIIEYVLEIMTVQAPNGQHVDTVREHFTDDVSWGLLLLLRGLFTGGILQYALKEKRWRVDYGLDRSRSMLAVPYRAKDVPALRAEFSHPDVTIALTCLSYLYDGLSEDELRTCFDLLYNTDNPPLEYETWTRKCNSLPPALKSLSGINIRSAEQWREILCLFRSNSTVINFFLSRVVFPRQAKQYSKKISTSSWDLAERKHHITTGFSGTNDNRYLLPLSMVQDDPQHQLGTNAKVLNYLLRDENNSYLPAIDQKGEPLTAKQFIKILAAHKPEMRILLDVGAQMLELQNHEVAEYWLQLVEGAEGVIYYNQDDEVVVQTRNLVVEKLLSSPLSQKLDRCLLYLDDAHTRGTDIKLPAGLRAAVTLGPKVTKDRLVQGCMRMRKLGNGHTVMFFAPVEVDVRIRQAARKTKEDKVEVKDILRWVIQETQSQIRYFAPQWAQQGIEYEKRSVAWKGHMSGSISSETLGDAWVSQEARTLEELYSPNNCLQVANLDPYPKIRERCEQLGITHLLTGLDEEEEREVVHELESERQVQRPPPATPAVPGAIHQDVLNFIFTGLRRPASKAFVHAFSVFDSLTRDDLLRWSAHVFATKEFAVTTLSDTTVGEHFNAVNWVVSSAETQSLVFISQHEVNELLPRIRLSKRVNLHVYTPRVLQAIESCESLSFYCIPPLRRQQARIPPPLSIITQMNAFAGQLYFKDYGSYLEACKFLGLYTKDLDEVGSFEVQSSGFVKPENRHGHIVSPFHLDQLPFVQKLITIRRKGIEYSRSHVGKILDGKLLTTEDFDDD